MTVRQHLETLSDQFTPTERQLILVLLADYPFAGLEPIRVLADRAKVSTPTISRFVNKLGYGGQGFQQKLLQVLKHGQRSPIDLQEDAQSDASDPLKSHIKKVNALNCETGARISAVQFRRVCDLIGDTKRRVFLIGGRMSDCIAEFFARHLKQIRNDVYHMPSDSEAWSDYFLRMRPKDIVIVIDFRRYQHSLSTLVGHVHARRAQTIVITDQWISPAAKGATELLAVSIDSKTLWDSYVPAFPLVEALLVPLAERNWDATHAWIEGWDRLRQGNDIGDPS